MLQKIRNLKLYQYLIASIFLFACNESLTQTIPIKMERNKTILPVTIGDVGPLDILFDSGLSFDGLMIYNPDLRDSIKLNKSIEVQIPGAGSGAPSTAIMDDSASFLVGNIEFKNQKIIVLQNDIYKGFPTDGIIGYSILGHYATEIDYDTEQITLHDPENFSPDESWYSIPIYFKDNPIPWIDVSISIEGEEPINISAYIDFAAGDAIVLLEKEEMKFSIPKETKEILLGRGLSGDIYGKEGKISKLKIGSFDLNEVKTKIAAAQVRSKQVGADAVIGNDALRRFNLIFDYSNKLLYIKPNKYFEEKFE
jgi:hypothetical protein